MGVDMKHVLYCWLNDLMDLLACCCFILVMVDDGFK